jgi:crotonobetainyl-CoA:carnitine CoA-transferase CaiB-like acyl-CoA transferase
LSSSEVQETHALTGVSVLEVSTMIAGPYAAMLLGDLGATVTKIESPAGDPARRLGARFIGEDSPAFHSVNRNKSTIVLDLHSAAGRAELRMLLASADVLITNLLPASARRSGLDTATLTADFPRLVQVNIGAFRANGDDANRPAYDIIIQAMSGLMSVTGEPTGGPLRPGLPVIDMATGVFAALGAVTAVMHQRITGVGQTVTVNMFDVAVTLQTTNFAHYFATNEQPARVGNGSYYAISNCFATADGWLAVAVGNDALWRRLTDALDDPWLLDDAFNSNSARLSQHTAIYQHIGDQLSTRSTEFWLTRLREFGVPHARVQSYQEALAYMDSMGHELVWTFEREDTGPQAVVGNPLDFSATPARLFRPPPTLDLRDRDRNDTKS